MYTVLRCSTRWPRICSYSPANLDAIALTRIRRTPPIVAGYDIKNAIEFQDVSAIARDKNVGQDLFVFWYFTQLSCR